MKKRLAVIFAAIHFIVVGLAILESGGTGEGLTAVFIAWDAPLLGLCLHSAACSERLYSSSARVTFAFLAAGTVMYAVAGVVIGAAIDWIRTLIARRRDRF